MHITLSARTDAQRGIRSVHDAAGAKMSKTYSVLLPAPDRLVLLRADHIERRIGDD